MRTTILLSLMGLVALLQAQPVITNSSQPQPGDECPYGISDLPIVLGMSPGGGQTWDLAGIPFTYDHTLTYLAPSDAPGHAYFPAATLAATNDQNAYEFYVLDPMQWSLVGDYISSSGDLLTCTDPLILFVYPCAFGTQWSDAYSYTVTNVPTEYHDTISVEFNAWGTVILPGGGTVTVIGRSASSFDIDTNGTDVWTYAESWIDLFSPNSPCEALAADHHTIWLNGMLMSDGFHTEVVDDPDIGVEETKAQKELELWPVPARTSLNIHWGGHSIAADAQVIDVAGKATAVRWMSIGSDTGVIDVTGLLPGTYLLRMADDAGRWIVRSFVVQ